MRRLTEGVAPGVANRLANPEEVAPSTSEQDAEQARYLRRLRDEFVAAVSVAASTGLRVELWGLGGGVWSSDDADDGRSPEIRINVTRTF